METKILLLKTLFCCSACDGDIAPEEVELVKSLAENDSRFSDMDIETVLNGYIADINAAGKAFLKTYLNELAETKLSEEDQLSLIDLAIRMIEADNQILYSEVIFFKKIRSRLSVTDEVILERMPGAEDYLLPDIMSDAKEEDWTNISFAPIKLS